jgi:hypothetical protein
MAKLIDLPRFPLTEKYEPCTGEFVDRGYYDQGLLFCERCGHGQLEAIVPPAVLYGEDYRTRTAASSGSMAAISRFVDFVLETQLDVEAVLDIGGNDASLVTHLPGARKIVVDPHAIGSAEIVRAFVEDADLQPYKGLRKLVVSSHTLEHLVDPGAVLKKLSSVICHDDWLAIQVPSLEAIVHYGRIDHIHHQHVHYFTRRSLGKLLAKFGFEVQRYAYSDVHWGALMVMCRRGNGDTPARQVVPSQITAAKERFARRMAAVEMNGGAVDPIGFGAALMLPVLAYWLPNLSHIEYIADNDPAKDGLRYINFNKPIRRDYELYGRNVVITAVGSRLAARELIRQAFDRGAQDVVVPLGVL